MRKLIRGVFFTLLAVLLLSVPASCDHRLEDPYLVDELYVADQIEATKNPVFSTSWEMVSFHNRMVEEYSIDEIFRGLSEDMVDKIASVCLKRTGSVTKRDVVSEYRANSDIYLTLSNQSAANISDATQNPNKKEAPDINKKGSTDTTDIAPPAIRISYHYGIDTINGKPTKVLIKEEHYETK